MKNQTEFFELYGFSNVLRYIDDTHVSILTPLIDEDSFVNRKNFHSINIQQFSIKFTDVVTKWPRLTHGDFIWRHFDIHQWIARGGIPTVNG